ncbi:MAG: CoA-disulfide reductase [Mycoplasmatales bacterium]
MKVVVIGANAAGMSFAAKYRRNKPEDEIIIFEKGDYISFGACGLPYYVAGEFEDKNEMFARTPEQIIEDGIDLRMNTEVISIDFDNKSVSTTNDTITYDKLIIATGANPIVPKSIIKQESENIQTLVSMKDGDLLKEKVNSGNIKHVLVIGGGFIGLEVMDAMHHNNIKVTLIEGSNSILSNQFGSDMTQIVEKNIKDKNIDLELDSFVKEIDLEDNKPVITLENDKVIKSDLVVLSIGFSPNTSFIEGIDKLKNGAIKINKDYTTSIKDVYAIGDCASVYNPILDEQTYLPLATNANKIAKSLADYLSDIETTFEGMIGSCCIKVLDYDLARSGITEKQASNNNIDYKVKVLKDKNHTSYYKNQEDIYIKLIYRPDNLEIIGAEVVGMYDVVQRLNVLALAISKGITTKELAYIDFAYAPPFSRTWEALNTAGNISK